MKLLCSACNKPHEAEAYDAFSLCSECDELAKAWAAERKRLLAELAEERLSSPRYASIRALLTYEPARLAARAGVSAH